MMRARENDCEEQVRPSERHQAVVNDNTLRPSIASERSLEEGAMPDTLKFALVLLGPLGPGRDGRGKVPAGQGPGRARLGPQI